MQQKHNTFESKTNTHNIVKDDLAALKKSYNNADYLSVIIFCNNALNNKKTKAKTLLKAQIYLSKSYYNLNQFNKSYVELNKIVNNSSFKMLSESDVVTVLSLKTVCAAKLNIVTNLQTTQNLKVAQNVKNIINEYYMPLILQNKPTKQAVQNYFKFITQSKKQNKSHYEHKTFNNVHLNAHAVRKILTHTQNEQAVNLLEHYIKVTTQANELAMLYQIALKIYRQTNLNKFLEHYDSFIKINNSIDKNLKNYHMQSLEKNINLITDIDNLSKDYYNDELTSTLNLKALKKYEANIKNNYGAVIYFDLNYLKTINDNHGHAVGDEYLKYFSSVVLKIKEPHHPLIRVGGDEFVLICLNYNENDADNFMKKLFEESEKPIDINNNSFKISYSAGIAMFNNPKSSLNKLIERADKTMYKAKQEYRNNNYKFYK